jgi:hypothetical protein
LTTGVPFYLRYFVSVRDLSPQPESSSQLFTLEVNGKALLVLEATGPAEAHEISLDADLRTDLTALTSEGTPICAEGATLTTRPAMPLEIAAFRRAVGLAPLSDEPMMAFLIKIDGIIVVTTGGPS